MTAFNQIKQNNWPAQQNQYDDYLVLSLPLNNEAALAESRSINAGSKVMRPAKALTGTTGIGLQSSGEAQWLNKRATVSISTAIANSNVTSNIFDGSTVTKCEWSVSGTNAGNSGTCTITFSPAVTVTSGLRVHAWLNDNQYDKHGVSINGGSYFYPNIYAGDNQWHDLLDSTYSNGTGFTGGTLNSISFRVEVDMNGQNPTGWVRAIEVDGEILTDGLQKKFYSETARFAGGFVEVPASGDLYFGQEDYTIEWWQYWNTITGYQTLYNMNYVSGNNLLIQTGNGTGLYRIFSNNASPLVNESGNAPATGVWHHYAVVRRGTTLTIYRNGSVTGSGTDSSDVGRRDTSLYIGAKVIGGLDYALDGYVQDLRAYKGVAKYTSTFTPPGPILS